MIVTIILTLCVFVSWLLISHKITRYILGSISTLALLSIIIGITANMTHHWGMEKKIITSNKSEIYSAGSKDSPTNILIANEIGKKTNNYIMVYKNQIDEKNAQVHFKPQMSKDNLSDSIKHQAKYEVKDTDNATVQTKKEIWIWKSDFYKVLFNFGKNNGELIKSTTLVTVPKDTWVVLNSEQAEKLKRLQKNQENQSNQQTKEMLQQSVAKYKKQHPNVSNEDVDKYIKHQKEVIVTKQIKKIID